MVFDYLLNYNLLDYHFFNDFFNDLLFNVMLFTSFSKATSLGIGTIAGRAAAH